jgi:hypothetical protein
MTRLNTNQEVVHDLRTVGLYGDSATSTTLADTGGVSQGGTSVELTSATNIAAGDVIRVGTQGNTCDISIVDALSGTTANLKSKLAFDHANGVAITKLTFTDIGATTDAGVTLETSQDETSLAAGTQKGTYLYLPGAVEQSASWSMLNFNPENLAQAFGQDESSTGLFVMTSPESITLNPNDFASLGEKAWKLEGLREDGATVTVHVFSAKVSSVNATITINTGAPAEIPFTLRSTGAMHKIIE